MTVLKKRAQLFFQEVLKCMEDLYDKSASEVGLANQSTVDNTSLKENEPERIDLTIKDYQEFSEKLVTDLVAKHVPGIAQVAEKLFTFRGVKGVS